MPGVASAGGDLERVVTAGPLRAAVAPDGELRIGWDEPDWLGPARLSIAGAPAAVSVTQRDSGNVRVAADWVLADVDALVGEPVVVLRLAVREDRAGVGSGEFATPAVAWVFEPGRRGSHGAPDGMRGFGHQYTEFALPVFSDEALSHWRLLPIRPPVVLPMGLVAPDRRTILLA